MSLLPLLFWLGPGAPLAASLCASWFFLCVKTLHAVGQILRR